MTLKEEIATHLARNEIANGDDLRKQGISKEMSSKKRLDFRILKITTQDPAAARNASAGIRFRKWASNETQENSNKVHHSRKSLRPDGQPLLADHKLLQNMNSDLAVDCDSYPSSAPICASADKTQSSTIHEAPSEAIVTIEPPSPLIPTICMQTTKNGAWTTPHRQKREDNATTSVITTNQQYAGKSLSNINTSWIDTDEEEEDALLLRDSLTSTPFKASARSDIGPIPGTGGILEVGPMTKDDSETGTETNSIVGVEQQTVLTLERNHIITVDQPRLAHQSSWEKDGHQSTSFGYLNNPFKIVSESSELFFSSLEFVVSFCVTIDDTLFDDVNPSANSNAIATQDQTAGVGVNDIKLDRQNHKKATTIAKKKPKQRNSRTYKRGETFVSSINPNSDPIQIGGPDAGLEDNEGQTGGTRTPLETDRCDDRTNQEDEDLNNEKHRNRQQLLESSQSFDDLLRELEDTGEKSTPLVKEEMTKVDSHPAPPDSFEKSNLGASQVHQKSLYNPPSTERRSPDNAPSNEKCDEVDDESRDAYENLEYDIPWVS